MWQSGPLASFKVFLIKKKNEKVKVKIATLTKVVKNYVLK
jgi:hypothetical protein